MKNSKYILAGMSAFCLVLITATSIKSSFLMPLRTGVGFVLVPLQSGVNAIGTGLYNTLENFSSLREAQEENKNLQMRLDQMVEENNRLQSELYELDRLRELYQLDQEYMQLSARSSMTTATSAACPCGPAIPVMYPAT